MSLAECSRQRMRAAKGKLRVLTWFSSQSSIRSAPRRCVDAQAQAIMHGYEAGAPLRGHSMERPEGAPMPTVRFERARSAAALRVGAKLGVGARA